VSKINSFFTFIRITVSYISLGRIPLFIIRLLQTSRNRFRTSL